VDLPIPIPGLVHGKKFVRLPKLEKFIDILVQQCIVSHFDKTPFYLKGAYLELSSVPEIE
jgi:hypothetical protein